MSTPDQTAPKYPRYEVGIEPVLGETWYAIFRRTSSQQRWGTGTCYRSAHVADTVCKFLNALADQEEI